MSVGAPYAAMEIDSRTGFERSAAIDIVSQIGLILIQRYTVGSALASSRGRLRLEWQEAVGHE
jgi:hypothetical protein